MTDLFTYVSARKSDPDTSQRAGNVDRKRDRDEALRIHREHLDGLTDFELGALMNRQQTSAGKRRGELRDAGYIIDSGQRRPSPSGSSAIVWKLTDNGVMAARECGV